MKNVKRNNVKVNVRRIVENYLLEVENNKQHTISANSIHENIYFSRNKEMKLDKAILLYDGPDLYVIKDKVTIGKAMFEQEYLLNGEHYSDLHSWYIALENKYELEILEA